ncbi:proteasome subunit beta type-2-like [Pararge aegeria]|uniref:proteasome subunit beta type-2-like n=1 Tax=Pararge aegeria TaxID=116150 RepID=UPI0019D0F327|nr:proteasome subunit beta type-2-like [Pararge aegeria]
MANATGLLFQCLFGFKCKDFTMIAADQMNTQSVLVMNDDVDKLYEVSDRLVLGVNGDAGDMSQFTQFIAKNLQLYKMKNQYQLDTPAVVHFIRKNLSDGLRSGNPNILNLMIGGYDEQTGGQLYMMDFLGSCVSVPYAAHGLGGLLTFGIMDYYYKPDLTEVQAYEVLKMCIREIQLRLFMNLPNFRVKSVSKIGVKILPNINSTMLTQK